MSTSEELANICCSYCNECLPCNLEILSSHPCYNGSEISIDNNGNVFVSESTELFASGSSTSSPSLSATSPTQTTVWTNSKINKLINLWKINEKKFSSASINNKVIWDAISKDISEGDIIVNGDGCNTKWRGLLRTYKRIKDNNTATGRGTRNWTFFDQMEEALSKRPEINLPSTASNSAGFILNDQPARALRQQKESKTPAWVQEVLNSHEARHLENLESRQNCTQKVCDVLEKFLQKM